MNLKLDHYARLSAKEMALSGDKPSITYHLKPFFRFIKAYYLKGGFLDGKLGLAIARANAKAQRKKYKYFWEEKKT